MSTEYIIHVKRNADNKEIGQFLANHLKGIFSCSKYENLINCEGNPDKAKFTYDNLEAVEDAVTNDIKTKYASVYEKKLQIPLCQNIDVKHEIEEDISYLYDDIDELLNALRSCNWLQGACAVVVEDMINPNIKIKDEYDIERRSAYYYNAEGLPKEKHKWNNGEEYESTPTIWLKDVYFEIEVC